jgi:hypothetical protein
MATATYIALANTTLSSAASSVTFSSIPATFRDLVLKANFQNSGTSSASRLRLNGDTGSNYSGVFMTGTGSIAASNSESPQTSSRAGGMNVGPDNAFTNVIIAQFLDANASDKHKTYLVRFGSANREVQATASRYALSSPITSITMFDVLGQTYSIGSTFSLYGIIA